MARIDGSGIRAELDEQGVSYLTVSETDVGGRHAVVCLHGNAGQAQQIEAIRILRALDGVRMVEVSSTSWTILIVRFSDEPDV